MNYLNQLFFYHSKDKNEYICPKCRGIHFNGWKGHHHTEEYKKYKSNLVHEKYKNGYINPFKGHHHTEEYKIRHSKTQKEKYENGYINPFKGHHHTEEYKKESSIRTKQYYDNLPIEKKKEIGERFSILQKKLKEKNPEKYYNDKVKAGKASSLSHVKYKKNKIEIKVENWLNEHNIENEYCCIMGFGDSCFQYDFIVKHKRILIEVQDDYWHGNPLFYNNNGSNGKQKLNYIQLLDIERDKRKHAFAIEKNFKILYIWENEINKGDFSSLKELLND